MESKISGRKIDVITTSDSGPNIQTDQEEVTLKSAGEFLSETSEIDNKAVEKIELSHRGQIYIYTRGGDRIDVYVKPKYSGEDQWLEIGKVSLDKKGNIAKNSHARLVGNWVKSNCPHCGETAVERETGLIDI